MLDPVRAVVAEIKRAVAADGLAEGHGHAIMAACDGLFFYRIFGLVRFDEAERAAMRAALGRLATAPGGAAP
jgi:hypothetical protein